MGNAYMEPTHFKRASLTWSRNDDMAIYLCSLDFDVDSPDVAWEEKLGNNKNRII